jgi:hypothetical protein
MASGELVGFEARGLVIGEIGRYVGWIWDTGCVLWTGAWSFEFEV